MGRLSGRTGLSSGVAGCRFRSTARHKAGRPKDVDKSFDLDDMVLAIVVLAGLNAESVGDVELLVRDLVEFALWWKPRVVERCDSVEVEAPEPPDW